jgi:hypothetical protein
MAGEYTPETLDLMRKFNDACVEKLLPLPAGITPHVPANVYHQRELGVVSKSALDELDRSPAHYRAWVAGIEREPTPALRFGSALHMALLEPARFARTYAVLPDFGDLRSSKNREKRDAWLSDRPGCVALSADDESRILGMLESVMAHPAASRLILEGQSEVTLSWTDPLSGLRCKSRADYWVKSRRLAVDIKSTLDASPKQFARDTYNYRYHLQDALYRAGFAECGEPIEFFVILAVEKDAPYAVAVYTLDEDAVAKGYSAARQGIERLADCLKHDHWPSYSDGVETLSLPPWAA